MPPASYNLHSSCFFLTILKDSTGLLPWILDLDAAPSPVRNAEIPYRYR
jgi:hypothetical protein